jgi:nucleoside triphosphate diphosphatase
MSVSKSQTNTMERLLAIMALLRDPKRGCPWDVEQTFSTIAPHTIEEAYEVADAIENNDMDALEEELGDLLLQVVFHAQMASEAGHFDFHSVAAAICEKLVRRHPHVFEDALVADAAAQTKAWEEHKAKERQAKKAAKGSTTDADHPSVLDGVALGFPALTRALKLQKRAERIGFDWRNASQVLGKFREECAELDDEMSKGGDRGRLEDEVGDLLFTCVNMARKLDLDPEEALRRGNAKFERRFRAMETALRKGDQSISPETTPGRLEALWEQAKKETA